MKISEVVRLRPEVITGDIHGWDSLRGIFEHGKEEKPQYIFGSTYPTSEIKSLLNAIDEKIRGVRETGFFEIMGGYGAGKSRILCLLYHLFKNINTGKKWLRSNKITTDIPDNVTVLAFSLMDDPPNYLWEPVFKGLGKENLMQKVTIFPGSNLLKKALTGKGITIIIIDEVESWYRGVKDKENNLNFLQVLAEAACEEKPKLFVFCALYGEVREILARIDRVEPYRVNLTLSKDRHKIILFRLLEDADRKAASKIVGTYLKYCRDAEVEILNPPSYEHRMVELYPIHPELIDTLLTRYSSSPNYQNTRGVLCLLASVLSKKFQDVDLLLSSDVDMTEGDLLSLDRILAENAQKDAANIGKDLTRSLLNTILLYSFGDEAGLGAQRNEVILGVLRLGLNINDVDTTLLDLPNVAPHVWIKDSRYIIGYKANIVTLIQNKALDNMERGKIDNALNIIKVRLRKDLSYLAFHPKSQFSDKIEDIDRIRIVVSLKTLNQLEINEFYKGKKFANRLILYIPKTEDLAKNEDLLVIAERLRLCDQYENEASGENKTLLNKLRGRDSRFLREKISEIYGYWVRVTGFENGEVKYRLVPCNLNEVRSQVKMSYDVETIRGEVLKHLEGKENGMRIEDVKHDFKVTPGKPIVVTELLFEQALRSLYGQEEIVMEYKGKNICKPDSFPSLKEDMKAILRKYAPIQQEFIKDVVVEKKPAEMEGKLEVPFEEFVGPKPEEISKKAEEAKKKILQIIETSEHSSAFTLSVEIERKVPENVHVKGIEIAISGCSFKDFKSFSDFASTLNIRKSKVSGVKITLLVDGPISKKEVIDLIDKLPPSLGGGNIKAVIETEKNA